MQIKSLLLGLGILGSSSVALADRAYEPRGDHTRRYFDDRGRNDDRFGRNTTWIPLTAPMRQFGPRAIIDVPMRDRFWQVRLQNKTGRTRVQAIVIVFNNGERQIVRVDRVLHGHRERVDIDLSGETRRIERIIVHGRGGAGATYQLYAM